VMTLSDEYSAVYQIAVAPSPTTLDQVSAQTRATKIGALVGLDAPDLVAWSGDQTVDQTGHPMWLGIWASQPGQKCPASDVHRRLSYRSVDRRHTARNGRIRTVLSFSRVLGPTQPKACPLDYRGPGAEGGRWKAEERRASLDTRATERQTFRLALGQLQYR